MVVRTDAACSESRQIAGLGWTIGHTTGSSSFATPAEGLALRETILKCRELNLPRLRCESDSATLVKLVNSELANSDLYGVVSDIIALASSFELVSFVWIPRERNFVANGLANQVLSVKLAINAPPNFG